MLSWSKSDDRVAIMQMNAQLRNAQLELLSAVCAKDRLRMRFSAEDIARYAERDVLRKAVASATALKDYYTSIAQQVPDPASLASSQASAISEEKVAAAIDLVRKYIRDKREEYRPQCVPLDADRCTAMKPFFPNLCWQGSGWSNCEISGFPIRPSTPMQRLWALRTCPNSLKWLH
ncbi:MAG: hypothetical protein ABSB87_03440 [Terriglobales bacterium]